MKTEQDVIGCLDKLNKLCRVCLCESNVKSELFNPYWESLFKKVMSCMQIDFLTKDTLPCEICDLCCKELEVADKLRIKCENSNAVLKRIYQQYLVKDEQKQSNQTDEMTILEDHLETCHSDEDLQDKTWDVPLEDDKEQIKDVILHINLEGSVLSEDKKEVKSKESVKCKTNKVVAKTEKEEENHKKTDLAAVKTNIYTCDMCNKQLKDKRTIIAHIAKQHSAEKNKEQSLFKVSGFGSDRLFHCTECPYKTKHKSHMKVHLRIHTGHKPHVCDICSRSFTQHATLAGHRLTHFDARRFICQECGKQFKQQRTLWNHQRVHSTELNFVCEVCNKRMKTKHSLSLHMLRHSQIRNHSCEMCGATFFTRAELANHKHRHTSPKRFFCTQCDFSCYWKDKLDMHTRRHRKDKTVQCDECEYACYSNAQLKLHKIRHTKEQIFPCSICDEKFKHKGSINKHMKRKHGQTTSQTAVK